MSKSSDIEMQTEIAQLLTSMVTETATPEPSSTPTLEPTKEPTMLPVVLVTATPETLPTSEEVLPILDITPSEGEFEFLTFTPTTSDGSDEVQTTVTPEDENSGIVHLKKMTRHLVWVILPMKIVLTMVIIGR